MDYLRIWIGMQFKNPIRMVEEMENVSPTVRGILLTIASGAFFRDDAWVVRLLSQDLDAMEIAFFELFSGSFSSRHSGPHAFVCVADFAFATSHAARSV